MKEASRLNMLDGHFFWLWIDASIELDVFHTVINKTQYVDDGYDDLENFIDDREKMAQDHVERRKRDDADNNSADDIRSRNNSTLLDINSQEESSKRVESSINNIRFNSVFRRVSRNINKSEAHSVNNKLLSNNFSQKFDSSRNTSPEIVRNFVYNKGVETSKVEKKSIEKRKMSFLSSYSNRYSSDKMNNESFDKYVNSINIENTDSTESSQMKREFMYSSENSKTIKDSILFSSDISDFLMNPTVHMSKVHSVRQTKTDYEDYNDEAMDEGSDENNITVIMDKLPVGLLALHPQPMKIDRAFIRAAVRLTVGALRRVLRACDAWSAQAQFLSDATASCWDEPSDAAADFSSEFVRRYSKTNKPYFIDS
ncbi:unnamed protein product [Diatraea saccharalis]|uniref:Uncharacterized protein n=1 Tax=Diatraea saccharalis TaxID=40085 RepID=A0A9N9WB48_9NEOP|nr:unnamed protein product [Diatraea saccharalis]